MVTESLTHWVAAAVISFTLGCAGSNVTPTVQASNQPIQRPGVILVYDFAVGLNDVVVDTLGYQFSSEATKRSKGEKEAYATADSLSEQLVEKLVKRGISAERASSDRVPPMNALVIKGQFLTIDQGSRLKRTVIGFGVGSSKLEVRVQVYQATERGLQRLAAVEVASHGQKMPGMAVPMLGGAAMGTAATSAVISGGMSIAKETHGAMRDDAGRIAEEIFERAEAFYQRQGWL